MNAKVPSSPDGESTTDHSALEATVAAHFAPAHTYPAGVTLIRQSGSVDAAYFIETGLVKLVHTADDGGEFILGLRFPGWLLGTSAIILGRASPLTVTTLTQCRLRSISAPEFMRLIKVKPELSWALHRMHCAEVLDQVTHVAQLSTLTSRQRLEQVLHYLIAALHLERSEKGVRLLLPLKQCEIAKLIAITPEHLSRLFSQMQREGIVRREKGWLIVTEPDRLGPAVDHVRTRCTCTLCSNINYLQHLAHGH